jgi:predicted nucleotidyltransferase
MKISSYLRYPLDRVMANASHIAILRALQDNREGLSGRATARAADINHQATATALQHLETLGIIGRQGSGRTQLWRLHFEHPVIRQLIVPLLQKERELSHAWREDIRQTFKNEVLAVTLFGSVARNEDVPGSDVDILFVVQPQSKTSFMTLADRFGIIFRKKYGASFVPLIMTPEDVRRRSKRKDPLLQNILKEGINLLPRHLRTFCS